MRLVDTLLVVLVRQLLLSLLPGFAVRIERKRIERRCGGRVGKWPNPVHD
jgi:hypothetical protein